MRLIHAAVHSLTLLYVVKTAYLYFDNKLKAQLMAFCFLAVYKERENWAQMFNDEVMMLYLAMSIYFLAKGKPMIGVFWFSMAYGMKAGALLLIPAMLGSI